MLDSKTAELHCNANHQDASATALYCRIANADEERIAEQEEALRRYAREHGYRICAVYRDNGAGGRTLDRPGLQLMMRDINAGKVKRVIVSGLDRLARDTLLTHELMKLFAMCGAELVSVREGGVMDSAYMGLLAGRIRQYMQR
jgi:DNA invertase Pin-like site-specific DNA recombinase